jgi:hypothetical protein
MGDVWIKGEERVLLTPLETDSTLSYIDSVDKTEIETKLSNDGWEKE